MTESFDMITQTVWFQFLSGYFGTIAFAILFGVPKQFYNTGGIVGAAGWITCFVLTKHCGFSPFASNFCASVVITFLSRCFAVIKKCPVTVFRISGLLPLVPGIGIYWTIYYMISDNFSKAFETGIIALKVLAAIIMGMVIVSGIPNKVFKTLFSPRRAQNHRSAES
ncbi:MAG: threonine/serine exporter family protein [Bacteroidales bacterium]|nr:threonine/serine exporter family protein [Bacteroidales bacterium]MBQ5540641.1 threonine/serine exporter family protein [Bacteroidales bacterium]MBR4679018.1 threonine/serine exporter family protein [Bacteroidales bacterium]